MKKIKLIFLFISLNYCFFSQNYTSRLFTTDDKLPDNYLYTALQDTKGFLWLASAKGLSKYDGQEFINYHLDSLKDDFVFSGAKGKNNELWFGTFTGKIYHLQKNSETPIVIKQKIEGSVNKIYASEIFNRTYFVSNGKGIFYLENDKLISIPKSKNFQINDLIETINGDLILATNEGLYIVKLTKNEIIKFNTFEFNCRRIQKSTLKKNIYYVSTTENGIYELDISSLLETEILKSKKIIQLSTDNIATFYLNEKTEQLYAATADEHLIVADLKTLKIQTFDEVKFLGNANSIFIDKENNIWITTTGKGLYRFYETEYNFINFDNTAIYSITEDAQGTMYYGTNDGLLIQPKYSLETKKFKKIGNTDLGKVKSLYFDKENIWIGTENKGLKIINPKTNTEVKLEFSNIHNITINSISGNKFDNTIIVNTNLDGAFIYNNTHLIQHFSVQNSLLHNNVYNSLKHKNGKIYYATHNTAFNFSIKNSLYEVDMSKDSLLADFNSFAYVSDSVVAIGTDGDGLYLLEDTLIYRFPQNDKLNSKFCNGLLNDKENNLWIMQQYNLYKYYTTEKTLQKIKFNTDKQQIFNPNACYKTLTGDVYFGTNKEVILFKHSTIKANKNLPTSYLTKIFVQDSMRSLTNELELEHGKYSFTFEYSALSIQM